MTDLRWKFLLTGREKSKISPHTLLGNLVGHNYDGNDGGDDSNGDGNDGGDDSNGDDNDGDDNGNGDGNGGDDNGNDNGNDDDDNGNGGYDDSNGYDKDEEYDDNAGTMVVMMMMFPPGMGCGLVGLLLTMVTSALVLRFI